MSAATGRSAWVEVPSILRLHIIGVAVTACLAFGWILTGHHPVAIAILGGVDWCLINLLNRITDLQEDLANGIVGTERVAAHRNLFIGAWLASFLGSFAVSVPLWPELTGWRLLVQLVGLGYSISLVPTPWGRRRFKDLYFFKNFMSAMLFVATVFVYPLTVAPAIVHPGGLAAAVGLAVFFVPFELTYEILYDMRDLEGDRLAGVPTYPVVHGLERSRQIVDALLVGAAGVMVALLLAGVVGLREGLMLVALVVQWFFYRPRFRRGLTTGDCIALTHLGSAQLVLFLVGTQLWLGAGLPANVFLR